MKYIFIVTLLASTNLSFIASFIAELSLAQSSAGQRRAEFDILPVSLIQVLHHRIRGVQNLGKTDDVILECSLSIFSKNQTSISF